MDSLPCRVLPPVTRCQACESPSDIETPSTLPMCTTSLEEACCLHTDGVVRVRRGTTQLDLSPACSTAIPHLPFTISTRPNTMSSNHPISALCSHLSNQDLSAACSPAHRYCYDAAPFLLSKPANSPSKMLHKTGFRFKQLISPRKSQSSEIRVSSSCEQPSPSPKPARYQKRPESQPSRGSRPSVENEHFPAYAHQSRKKSATSSTTHSSSSSLCSCDSTVVCAGSRSLSKAAAAPAQAPPNPPAPSSTEVLYLGTAENAPLHGDSDARTWRLIFSDLACQSPLLSFCKSSEKAPMEKRLHNSTFNLLEALAIEPVSDNERTPTPSLNLSPKTTKESVSSMSLSPRTTDSSTTSAEIESLARQTDEAFKAVGDALEEAKASTRLFTMPSSLAPSSSQQLKKQRKAPIARTKSRAKHTKPQRRKADGQKQARWTISVADVTDNVADIFTGRIFKNDVEELIDTSKLGQTQAQRLSVPVSPVSAASPKQSAETSRSSSTASTSPTPDPFVLDSLPTRLTASGLTASGQPQLQRSGTSDRAVKFGEAPAGNQPPPIPAKDSRRCDSAGAVNIASPLRAAPTALASIPELSLVSPPDLHLGGSSLCLRHSSNPYTSRKSSYCKRSGAVNAPRPPIAARHDDELPSTPFTLFSSWQQGGIRLLRGEKAARPRRDAEAAETRGPGQREERSPLAAGGASGGSTPADDLDLSAFQMAMCVGEWQAPVDDDDTDDDVCAWVADLGVSVGSIVSAGDDARRRAGERLAVRHDERRVRAVEEASRGRCLRRPGAIEIDGREVYAPEAPRSADQSLPPSPLAEFGAGVPMGFNLGHDLDDYLKWERGVVGSFGSE